MDTLTFIMVMTLIAFSVYLLWPQQPAKFIENKNRQFGEARGYWRLSTQHGQLLLTEYEFNELRRRADRNPEDV